MTITHVENLEQELRQVAEFVNGGTGKLSASGESKDATVFEVTGADGSSVLLALVTERNGHLRVERFNPDDVECLVLMSASAEIFGALLRGEINQRAIYDNGQLRIKKGALVDLVKFRSLLSRYTKARRRGKIPMTEA